MKFAQAVLKRTKELLFEKNISQYRLIKDTCISKTTLQSINKNKTKDIKMSTVVLIANFFGMHISEFLDHEYFNYENIDLD